MYVKEAAEPNLVSDIKRDIPKFDTVLLHSNWSSLRQKYLSKIPTDINELSSRQKYQKFREFQTPFSPRNIRKNPRSMCVRVPQAMAQFVLKIEKLSHIIGTAPKLEMARTYCLRPRLWLLVFLEIGLSNNVYQSSTETSETRKHHQCMQDSTLFKPMADQGVH